MKLHTAVVPAVEMFRLAEVRVPSQQNRFPAIALAHHTDALDFAAFVSTNGSLETHFWMSVVMARVDPITPNLKGSFVVSPPIVLSGGHLIEA